MNRDISKVLKYLSVPLDDPRLEGAGPGEVNVRGEVCYVREDDWLALLKKVAAISGGPAAEEEFVRSVTH